jgi:hypothetical protein
MSRQFIRQPLSQQISRHPAVACLTNSYCLDESQHFVQLRVSLHRSWYGFAQRD